MERHRISTTKIRNIILNHSLGRNITQTATKLKMTRYTVRKYILYFNNSDLQFAHIYDLKNSALLAALIPERNTFSNSQRYSSLQNQFPIIHEKLKSEDVNLKSLWKEYKVKNPDCHKYSTFVFHYHCWRERNGLSKIIKNKWMIPIIPDKDRKILNQWKLSTNRNEWEKAVAILDLHKSFPITKISNKIERSCSTIIKWQKIYLEKGIEGLPLRRYKKVDAQIIQKIKIKKERLIKILHQSPQLFDLNRTSWRLKDLAEIYNKIHGEKISKSMVSVYIKEEGYSFKKARKVLTSSDPDFRIKLKEITSILSNLSQSEKFFSIDEFGPFSIRLRGGKAITHKDNIRTIPQIQKSKGSLICTAALELSTNQVTHFYSEKKNTYEMIKLLELLVKKYHKEECIFFSWDAASWHASKKLYQKVDDVNNSEYREKHKTPIVKLAPLPSSAQFLNVIESVFSGMARAIIHNSDYQSTDECKKAIDRYFLERNTAFIKNPKRAGGKIWGKEVVKPQFNESNNCKNPSWR